MLTAVLTAAVLASTLTTFATVPISVTDEMVETELRTLDHALEQSGEYVHQRHHRINALKAKLRAAPNDAAALSDLIGEYSSFNNDSAIAYATRGYERYRNGRNPRETIYAYRFLMRRLALMPLSGFFEKAIHDYEAINPDSLPAEIMPEYYDAGRQLYSYVAGFFPGYTQYNRNVRQRLIESQQQLLATLPDKSPAKLFYTGEYYMLTGEPHKARAYFEELYDGGPETEPYLARVAHHLSTLAGAAGNENEQIYYLSRSAMADLTSATLEVRSLQDLGGMMYRRNDVDRAYNYLSKALDNAVTCGATMRMIESSRSMPIIERAHSDQMSSKRRMLYVFVAILVLLLAGMVVLIVVLRREMGRMTELQQNLRGANRTKEVYISQFLQLCSIYMDKLNQFSKLVNRKITVGKVDDLYRLTKSGKFVEEQSKEFYEVFDNAFLHIYPDFVSQVNELLRDDAKIELKEGELLNTELRILAFLRLGIQDSPRIAQVLNYSLNTIYSYRNRIKNRARNRDTFEEDVMRLSSME